MAEGSVGELVTLRIEPIRYLLECGLADMAERHWHEVMDGDFDPDWQEVMAAEDQDRLRWFVARESGELAGYASVLLVKSMTNKGKINAVIQDLFVDRQYRQSGVAVKLLRFVFQTMKTLGISCIMIGEPLMKANRNLGSFYRRLGFSPIETIWERGMT